MVAVANREARPTLISLRPRSIFGVAVAGYVLIALPVAVVATLAAMYAKLLSEDSRRLLEGGIQIVQQGLTLEDSLVRMERSARQYQVLGEPELIEVFSEREAQMDSALHALRLAREQGTSDWGMSDWQLDRIGETTDELVAALKIGNPKSPALGAALEHFSQLHPLARHVTVQARSFIDREAETINRRAMRYRRVVLGLGVVLLPLAAGMALLLALQLVRPLRAVDRVIRDLGAQRLDGPIEIGGPHELRVLGRQLDWLRGRLQTVDQDKSRFLREMAHDLKTPLASVREGTELLADGVLGEVTQAQREVVDILRTSSLELQLLIENLLDHEAWRDKAGHIDRTWFSMRELAAACVRRYRVFFAARHLFVVMRCAEFQVCADRDRLRLSLDNLLSNALKFSPEGGTVFVAAYLAPAPAGSRGAGDDLVIEVADEGPGIPAAERKKIFHAFYKGRPPQGRHLEGTGVGLAVVYDCVAVHGGDVTIVDGEYRGAHFRIRVPLPEAGEHARAA